MAAVRTTSGRLVELRNVRSEDVDIDDIATSLSRQRRFSGHGAAEVTIADHAVLVMRLTESLGGTVRQQFAALHHDDHEAYLSDIPSPVTRTLDEDGVKHLKYRVDRGIAAYLGIEAWEFRQTIIHDADLLAFGIERAHLWPGLYKPPSETPFSWRPMTPTWTKSLWLMEHRRLHARLEAERAR